jgi:hypothetical protein
VTEGGLSVPRGGEADRRDGEEEKKRREDEKQERVEAHQCLCEEAERPQGTRQAGLLGGMLSVSIHPRSSWQRWFRVNFRHALGTPPRARTRYPRVNRQRSGQAP